MKCPKCNKMDLRATKLEDELVAANCQKCDGNLIPLFFYRDWAKNASVLSSNIADISELAASDAKAAIICPKCGKLMTKYRIDSKSKNHIDICHECDEAWLDGGEWNLLKELNIHDSLTQISTESWQNQIHKQECADRRRTILIKTVGEELTDKVDEFKAVIDSSKYKEDIIRYLNKD